MLTFEQKESIRKCYESYAGWGENAPNWFTCETLMQSELKYLPFCDVYGYIQELDAINFERWQKYKVKLAEERKKKEELEKLKKEEAEKNGQGKGSRKIHDRLSDDIVDDAAERNK